MLTIQNGGWVYTWLSFTKKLNIPTKLNVDYTGKRIYKLRSACR
uniref:Uncharacterized protein n=1 Tax=Arundo donax TaxID=35708 RepID=A0A0A9CBP8_ARUDO